jgi:hypothetical protein
VQTPVRVGFIVKELRIEGSVAHKAKGRKKRYPVLPRHDRDNQVKLAYDNVWSEGLYKVFPFRAGCIDVCVRENALHPDDAFQILDGRHRSIPFSLNDAYESPKPAGKAEHGGFVYRYESVSVPGGVIRFGASGAEKNFCGRGDFPDLVGDGDHPRDGAKRLNGVYADGKENAFHDTELRLCWLTLLQGCCDRFDLFREMPDEPVLFQVLLHDPQHVLILRGDELAHERKALFG